MERKAWEEAASQLSKRKAFADAKMYQSRERLEEDERAGRISLEEFNRRLDLVMDLYDRDIAPAELEYDKAIDKIRTWKKIRRELR